MEIAADGKSGDSSGLLFAMPREFMSYAAKNAGYDLPEQFAVAQVFFTDEKQKDIFKTKCEANDLNYSFFRKVPVNTEALGSQALEALPSTEQVFVVSNSLMSADLTPCFI